MATENKCPHCGKPVPSTALQGICPECMLKAGLADTGEVGPEGTVVAKASAPPIPRVEDLAPHFPQLEILECLGRGGMGAVYKARQPKLDRFVALKILSHKRDNGMPDAEFAQRFEREARSLARLNHPDIVAIYDFGEAGGFHYLLMEFVDGLTLRQLLQSRKLSPEEALAIVPKICEALQFAHERGIVHRDIKPENILLDKQGQLKIADFGIAKIVGQSSGASLTQDKQVIGTPHYMAPEQVEKPATVDHRADIFSLGVVFYEMLTGELPLGKFSPPSRKVHVDVRLDEVVLHALEKEPDRRYQHASEVKSDVETISAKSEFPHPSAKEAGDARTIGWGNAALAGAALFCVLGIVVVFGWLASDKSFPLVGALGAVLAATVVIISFSLWLVIALARLLGKPVTFKANTSRKDPQAEATEKVSGWVTAARWTARVLGTLLLIFYGVFVLAEGLPPIATQPEGVQLNFVALGLMLAGFVVGWKREGTAALLIASGWTLWQISENAVRWNLFQTPLPVALLYGLCWWVTRGRRSGVVVWTTAALAVAFGLGRLLVPTSVFVRGQVVDALTGQPVQNVELRLLPRPQRTDKGDLPNARSDDQGRYRLYVGWYAAGKQVTLSADGYTTLTTNLGPRPLGVRRLNRDFQLWSTQSTNHFVIEFDRVSLRDAIQMLAKHLNRNVIFDRQLELDSSNSDGKSILLTAVTLRWQDVSAEGAFDLLLNNHGLKVTVDSVTGISRIAKAESQTATAARPETPPVVIGTFPVSGTADVDSALKELRVTFSRPMRDGCWSWVKLDDATFPTMTGESRYLPDGRTCVLPVELHPGRTYAVWINVDNFQSFQDASGLSALPYLLIFQTRP